MIELETDREPFFGSWQKASRLLWNLVKDGKEIVLTIQGQAELVVRDEKALELLRDLVDRLELIEAIGKGLRECDEGKGMSLEEARGKIRTQHGVSH